MAPQPVQDMRTPIVMVIRKDTNENQSGGVPLPPKSVVRCANFHLGGFNQHMFEVETWHEAGILSLSPPSLMTLSPTVTPILALTLYQT